MPRFAAAQFFSGPDPEANLEICRQWARRAKAIGAGLVVLPENANRVRDYPDRQTCWQRSERIDGSFVTGLQQVARDVGIWIVVGVDLADADEPTVHIAQLLIDETGQLIGRVNKHVLWDYEYTLFRPGNEPFQIFDTDLGRLGLLMCADGIVPETPRALSLLGAQVLLNSLNSRGPDEVRVHVPLRALENHVWHVAANTVGGPADAFPWMGGSQVVAPNGQIAARAAEDAEDLIWADVDLALADTKSTGLVDDVLAWRRPDLYGALTLPIQELPVAEMYGAANPDTPRPVNVALMQVSWFHSAPWTLERVRGQIAWAGRSGATVGVLPELFAHRDGEVRADPAAAADRADEILDVVGTAATDAGMYVAGSLVERDSERLYHTAYLVGPDGQVTGRYRKTHLNRGERQWATAGDELPVFETPIGRIALLIGDEIWIPEAFRVLAVAGAELVLHPTSWDRPEAAHIAATERTEENRVHLASATRLDGPTDVGSQLVRANAFQGGEPIALMRYPTAYWTRSGFEEQLVTTVDLNEAHSKLMGPHLDVLATRAPHLYDMFVT